MQETPLGTHDLCEFTFFNALLWLILRRVWRYKWGNQNPNIKEEQLTQWSKEKAQKDKQRYTKHAHIAKHRVTWIEL